MDIPGARPRVAAIAALWEDFEREQGDAIAKMKATSEDLASAYFAVMFADWIMERQKSIEHMTRVIALS